MLLLIVYRLSIRFALDPQNLHDPHVCAVDVSGPAANGTGKNARRGLRLVSRVRL